MRWSPGRWVDGVMVRVRRENLQDQRIRQLVEWEMQQERHAQERRDLGLLPIPKKSYPW